MPDVFDLAPKVELHVHLEGAFPAAALWELIEQYGDPDVRSVDDLGDRFTYRDFPHFIDTWWWMTGFIRTGEDFTHVADAVAASMADQNIVYAEASISPADFARHGLGVGDIAAAVRTGLDRVDGVEVALIVDLVRDTGPDASMRTLDEAIEVADEAGIVGITIGGSEQAYPPELFVDVYRVAGEAGLGLTAHAGEAAGPESVWSALRDLGVSRIGHGVRAVEDPALVDHLVERQVPLEVCPTSNLRTGVVASWASHPVLELIERSALVTINSDDPLFFDSALAGELRRVSELAGVQAERLTLDAVEASWMSAAEKAQVAQAVTDWWAGATDPGDGRQRNRQT